MNTRTFRVDCWGGVALIIPRHYRRGEAHANRDAAQHMLMLQTPRLFELFLVLFVISLVAYGC